MPDQLRFDLGLPVVESPEIRPIEDNPFMVEYVDPWTHETVSLQIKRPDDLPKEVDRLRREVRSPLPIAVTLVAPSGDGLTVGFENEIGFAYHWASDPRNGTNRAAMGDGTRGCTFSIFGAPSPLAAKWILSKALVIQAVERWVFAGELDP